MLGYEEDVGMKCVYLLVTVAVLCLSAETAFAQQSADFVRAPAIVDGADNFTIDFGFYPIGSFSIGDWVWEDLNKDGIQQVGEEPGIPGVRVELWQDGTMKKSVISESFPNAGRYIFSGLTNGTYEVRIPMDQPALENMTCTTPNAGNDDIDSDGIPTP